ncbi:MAG: DUF2147 domain-containing protein [Hyphomicrobiaceae bacterium]|nr:DUF2147 domain-containing protein [Hyphomicrobiaceae bacterium]
MPTFNAIKGALMALAAQGSVTITVPDDIEKTHKLEIGDIEITIQLPKNIKLPKTIKLPETVVTRPEAPAKAEPQAAQPKPTSPAAPSEATPPSAPEEVKAPDAPAKVVTRTSPSEDSTQEQSIKQTGYTGLWYDHSGRSAIKIDECGEGLCGKIAWLKNSDHKSVCGTDIIGGVQKVGNAYDNGWIYDIERGRKFDVELKLLSDKQLRVKGYAGTKLLSKTMIWKRAPSDLALCS